MTSCVVGQWVVGATNARLPGPVQPLAYLHSRRDLEPGPSDHRKTNAMQAQAAAHFNARRSELERTWEQFVHL